MNNKKFYLTTPLYYVNAKPHIGHAYTTIIADAVTRYHRIMGRDVFFLTGTDEHGTKIEKVAREQGKQPKDYVDGMVPLFKSLWSDLGIEYDFFIRTTDALHKKSVAEILMSLEKSGDIYESSYKGWYCTPCESFWTDLQLKEGKCPDCSRAVQELTEQNYFFRLSKYQEWLIRYIQEHPDFVRPEMRRNEILGFLKQPLEDLCITRSRSRLSWGIDYPSNPEYVVYVWFDALINYISAAGYPADPAGFQKLWPADLHLVGKDILRQHAVYWPIMLKAMNLPMPQCVLAHGWWTIQGAKVSKSLGNVVDPLELAKKYGVDSLRYFLLKEVTLGFDGAFSEELLRERYTTDLANDLGNLWFRLASMLDKYFASSLPVFETSSAQNPLMCSTYAVWRKVAHAMEQYDLRDALTELWLVIRQANQFVEENKPWVLAKDPAKKGELGQVMVILAETMAHLTVLIAPFLPATANKILHRLGLDTPPSVRSEEDYQKPFLKSGTLIQKGEILFPKLDEIP